MFRRKCKKSCSGVEKPKNKESQNNENKSCDDCAQCAQSAKLDSCKKELAETKENLIRVSADLQNFKRRVEKEKMQWISIAQSELIHDLLLIIDDFDRALKQEQKEISKEVQVFLDGFTMIHKSLYKFLEKNKVKEIAQVKTFDPEFHEAISQIDSPEHKSGEIIEVVQKGFVFKDKVLRPAKVVVAK
ncbi:nucleotide exchange factor GrpE [Candidatus Dependentiae bacterium]